MINHAAWSISKGTPVRVDVAPYPELLPGHVVVRNSALAINPIDFKVQNSGAYVQTWPFILGQDTAGIVVDTAEDVTTLHKGQRVMAFCTPLASANAQKGSFQLFTLCSANLCTPIPDAMSFAEACSAPLAIAVAGVGLFGKAMLGLPPPQLMGVPPTQKAVLIWGGSSSVGSAAIQLASAAGIHVVSTASQHNHGLVRSLGAQSVFDYRDNNHLVDQLIQALDGTDLVGVYDCIGLSETMKACAKVLAYFGGGRMVSVNAPPEDVVDLAIVTKVFAPLVLQDNLAEKLFQKFLPQALEDKIFRPALGLDVVGHGLESIQAGLDRLRDGVSATKLIVTL